MDSLTIRPNWNAPARPLRHSWAGLLNVDQFRWFVRRDLQEQLAMVVAKLGARHVRAVGMFDDELRFYTVDPATWREKERKPQINFQIIDYVMDSLLDLGLRPMFTTTFVPGALSSSPATVFETRGRVGLPKDWGERERLVREAVRHAVER